MSLDAIYNLCSKIWSKLFFLWQNYGNFSFTNPFFDFNCIFLSHLFLKVEPNKIYLRAKNSKFVSLTRQIIMRSRRNQSTRPNSNQRQHPCAARGRRYNNGARARRAAKGTNFFQPNVVLVSRPLGTPYVFARARCIYFRTEFLARNFPWEIAI